MTSKLKNIPPAPKESTPKETEIEVSIEKCRLCGFASKSKLVIKQHLMSRHSVKYYQQKEHKCLMCHEFFKDKTSYKKHKAEHQRELDVITLKDVCKECSICFGSREDYLSIYYRSTDPTNL